MPKIATRVTESGAAGSAPLERFLGVAKPLRGRLAEARRELLQLRQVDLPQIGIVPVNHLEQGKSRGDGHSGDD